MAETVAFFIGLALGAIGGVPVGFALGVLFVMVWAFVEVMGFNRRAPR